MNFTVLTVLPEIIKGFFSEGLVHQAIVKNLIELKTVNPRDYTSDSYRRVDDRVFGGRDGMVMKAEPLKRAIEAERALGPCRVVVMSPQGRQWNQSMAREWSQKRERTVLVCGRYGGIDQRFINQCADEEVSLGDFILNGGEVAACAVIESVVRLLPDVLGNAVSSKEDSFSEGLLEAPAFTRPQVFDGEAVPGVLLSGDHAQVARIEQAVALVRTATLRPDLFSADSLSAADRLQVARHLLASLSQSERTTFGLKDL